jgi:transposase-like protein
MSQDKRPEKCPYCGSPYVVRKCKDTFQFEGWICVDCLRKVEA